MAIIVVILEEKSREHLTRVSHGDKGAFFREFARILQRRFLRSPLLTRQTAPPLLPIFMATLPLFSATNRPNKSLPVDLRRIFHRGRTTSRWKSSWNGSPTWRPFLFTKWREFCFANRAPVDYWKPWKRKGRKTTFEYRSAVRDSSTRRWNVTLRRIVRRSFLLAAEEEGNFLLLAFQFLGTPRQRLPFFSFLPSFTELYIQFGTDSFESFTDTLLLSSRIERSIGARPCSILGLMAWNEIFFVQLSRLFFVFDVSRAYYEDRMNCNMLATLGLTRLDSTNRGSSREWN